MSKTLADLLNEYYVTPADREEGMTTADGERRLLAEELQVES